MTPPSDRPTALTGIGSRARTTAERETKAIRRVFSFHDENHDLRKFMLFVLITTWAIITVGIAFGEATNTGAYGMLTALIWAVIGRLWDGEVKDLTGGSDGGPGM
jgi:hypothetical protein